MIWMVVAEVLPDAFKVIYYIPLWICMEFTDTCSLLPSSSSSLGIHKGNEVSMKGAKRKREMSNYSFDLQKFFGDMSSYLFKPCSL